MDRFFGGSISGDTGGMMVGRLAIQTGFLALFVSGLGFPATILGQVSSIQLKADLALIGHAGGLWVVSDGDPNDGVLDQIFEVVGHVDPEQTSITLYLPSADLGWDEGVLWVIGAVEGRQRLVLRVQNPATSDPGSESVGTQPIIETTRVEGMIECHKVEWQRLETLFSQLKLSSTGAAIPISELIHLASEEASQPGFLTQFGNRCTSLCRPGTEPPNCRPAASGE